MQPPDLRTRPVVLVADDPPHQLTACCPSCGQTTTFTLLGTQTWPEKVAAALGVSTTAYLWRCESCQTTITNIHEQR